MSYRTGYFANTGRGTKVHVVRDGKLICGIKISKSMEFQVCAWDVDEGYVECEHCIRVLKTENRFQDADLVVDTRFVRNGHVHRWHVIKYGARMGKKVNFADYRLVSEKEIENHVQKNETFRNSIVVSKGKKVFVRIRLDDMEDFNFPKKGEIGIKRQHRIEREFDPRNPINIESITFFVNGKPVQFVKNHRIKNETK